MFTCIWDRFQDYLRGILKQHRAATHSRTSRLPVASLLVSRETILNEKLGSVDAAAAREGDLRIAEILDHQGLEDERDR